jgi:hypothetical protein
VLQTEGVSSRKGWPELVVALEGTRCTLVSSSQLPLEVVEIVETVEAERSGGMC